MTHPCRISILTGITILFSIAVALQFAEAQQPRLFTFPEQRSIQVRDPHELPTASIPDVPVPNTVDDVDAQLEALNISLDEAIRMALERAEVIRVLTGVSASTSGRTIYDVAISNTGIDQQNALFDPTFNINSTFGKVDRPVAILDPLNPGQSLILGSSTDSLNTSLGVSQRMFNGANVGLNVIPIRSYLAAGSALNPEDRVSAEMTLRQPLMRGYGRAANLTPIVVARIDTERSFFQFKDTTQELVRGVINAYWTLVAARVDVWARQQQVEQAEFGFKRASARQEEGLTKAADVAQARSALANFRANLIAARSNRILAETALRNILGLPPSGHDELVPTSAPQLEQLNFDWNYLLAAAEKYRPDIIELKLIIEADNHLLLQANNQARPQLDGVASYRWDGVRGEMPNGLNLQSGPGQFAGYNAGINFSVPIGLRQSRAGLRRQELINARDKANLDQGIHQMVHQVTISYRNLAQFYLQINAFKEARKAALMNYENQIAEFMSGRQNFLNVLQAITDWGNAVSQEARSVTQYNTELANIERQTGTILESHGIVFSEERFSTIGPRGRLFSDEFYPSSLRPVGEIDHYPDSGRAAENSFDLTDLDAIKNEPKDKPIPDLNLEPLPKIDEPVPDGKSPTVAPKSQWSKFNQKLKDFFR